MTVKRTASAPAGILQILFRRSTLLSVIAIMVVLTTSVLALMDKIDGPTYFGLTLLIAGALYKADAK